MNPAGTPIDRSHTDSPFHRGEREAQARAGMRDRLEIVGRKAIRDHLTDQHRAFYAGLPFVLLGSVDARGRPWASLMAGHPGFLSADDPKTLRVAGRPLFGDPLAANLGESKAIGVLGIEPATRRRNRLSGRIRTLGADGFVIGVDQAFGNCPKYIQSRHVEWLPGSDQPATERPLVRSTNFDERTVRWLEHADTLFIATASPVDEGEGAHGVDVSHRGGKPGFVRVENDRTFVLPDFSGNFFFNTIGNLLLDPRAGLLFVDFDRGDLCYLTGRVEVIWQGPQLAAFEGAERLLRLRLDELIRVEGSLPLRFEFGEYSPVLARTGSWEAVDRASFP